MTADWLILQVFRGNPFRIEEAIGELGIQAYVPKLTIRRRDPRDKARILDIRKPLLPGYCFANERFNLEALAPALLSLAKRRQPDRYRQTPATIDARVRWLALDSKPLLLTREALASLREAERAESGYHATIACIADILDACGKGKAPKSRFVRLADWQGVAA